MLQTLLLNLSKMDSSTLLHAKKMLRVYPDWNHPFTSNVALLLASGLVLNFVVPLQTRMLQISIKSGFVPVPNPNQQINCLPSSSPIASMKNWYKCLLEKRLTKCKRKELILQIPPIQQDSYICDKHYLSRPDLWSLHSTTTWCEDSTCHLHVLHVQDQGEQWLEAQQVLLLARHLPLTWRSFTTDNKMQLKYNIHKKTSLGMCLKVSKKEIIPLRKDFN